MRNWKRQTKRMKRIFAMLVAAMLCLSPLQQHVLAAEIPEEAVTPEETTEPEVTTVLEETTSLEGTITPEDPETPATSSNAEESQGAEELQEPVVKQERVQSVTEAAAIKATVQEAVASEDPEITGVIYVNANSEPENTTETTETLDDSAFGDVSSEEPGEAVPDETQNISGDDVEADNGALEEDDVKTEETSNEENENSELADTNVPDEEAEPAADAVTTDETVSDETDDVQIPETVQVAEVTKTVGAPAAIADEGEAQKAKRGSKENPCSTLSEAVELADTWQTRKDVTIEIQTDLTATACARINGKDVRINGNGHTITRGDKFDLIADNARSWYNPAMIEVCNSMTEKTASLRLEDITLDDGGKTAGTKYSQATTDGKGGNDNTVQDAIIATYDGVGTITLGDKVTLKGYGGMSAVRLSGGTLKMESGSLITGGKDFTTKGGGNGPAGAIWIQGGSFTMDEGAKIDGVTGRAVYVDGGSAMISGTISNITANGNMWQGQSGTAIHVRGKGYAVLEASGIIEKISGEHNSYRGAIATNGSRGDGLWDFEAKAGSIIRDVTGFPTVYSNYGTELLDGTISGCTNDFIIGGFAQKTTIGVNGVIEKCTARGGAANAIVYTSNASKIYLRGKVRNNTASHSFYIINQSGGGASLEMYDGAVISGNSGSGVYVNASGCSFTMHGGTIEENGSYGVYVREKSGNSAKFVMENGRIINNGSYGVYYTTLNTSGYVDITGGEISGNGTYLPYQVNISGSYAKDVADRICIKTGIVKAENGKEDIINTSFGQLKNITLGEGQSNIYLGNAMSAASSKIKELVNDYKVNDEDTNEYTTKGSALWFKPTTNNLHFTVPRSYSVNVALPLYVAYIPLKADGTPMDDAPLTAVKVDNVTTINVKLKDLTPNQPYALMWMQPKEKFGTFTVETETPEVNELLGHSDYVVEYKASYTLTKDIAGYIQSEDIFTTTVELDSALSYKADSLKLLNKDGITESSIFELVKAEVNNSGNVIVTMKVKDGCTVNSGDAVVLLFSADAKIPNAEFKDGILKTNGYLTGSINLPGGDTNFKVETPKPAETILKALPVHTVTYTGGSITVKEGTALALDLAGGAGTTSPATVMEDITLSNPGRDGYSFAGWRVVNGITANGIPSVTFTAQWTANETPAPTPTPTTPTGGTTGTTTPPAPAPLAMAQTVLPAAAPTPAAPTPDAPVEIAEPETPLAEPESPAAEPEEAPQQIEEPEVPLASGVQGSWALLNLLLMLFTAVSGLVLTVSAARREEENEKRKKALRISSLVPAVVSVAVFVLTENLRAPMRFVNARTMWMVLFAAAQIALIVLSRKSEEEAQVEK